ncbi:sensor histidine kinase [Streptosporangium sandarakinum]|uniref:sensor histidine kinase n=1 Tax=Streptosporangium sandarakinum TaxID=1260955 RepID=UPI0034133656
MSSAGELMDRRRGGGALTLARVIVAVVFCGFGVTALLWVLDSGRSPAEVTLAVACLCGLLSLQYFYFGRPRANPRSPYTYVVLATQACLAYLPLLLFGQAWVSQPPFLAGSVLLVFRPPVAWPLYAVVVASTGVNQAIVDHGPLNVTYIVVNSATAGLFVYGLTRLAWLVTALHEARDELAKTAVAHERLRFAHHLHDLFGSSLSKIAPKADLVWRDPERAGRELHEIREISRRALADVRSIAHLYRDVSMDGEGGPLASMLADSHVDLRIDPGLRRFPPHVRTALAAVLREAVAYVLRHHEAEHREIVLRQQDGEVSVEIVIDGAAGALSALPGEVTVETDANGRRRLRVTLAVTARPPEDPGEAASPDAATKLAGGLVVVVFCGLFLQAVGRVLFESQEPWAAAVSVVYLLPALALQLACFSRPGTSPRASTAYLLLAVQGFLVYAPLLQLRLPWMGMEGFLAASALLVLRPALGWGLFAVIIATVAWSKLGFGSVLPRDTGQDILTAIDQGLIVYGLTWMARTIRQLGAVRRELAEAALAETRVRFVRDLHDLLGLSLSAIALKSDLADELIRRDVDRARAELAKLRDISQRALADVRSVIDGYHEMSLDEEARAAESLLATAGLNVQMDLAYGDLPPEVGTVLAMVLRESVANVLRHGKGGYCEIIVHRHGDEVCLRIVNDGAVRPHGREGSGIRNMSERVSALSGAFTAGYEGDGRFGLSARVPVRPARSA